MILRTFYKDAQALVNVPDGSLVFDGKEFVNPAKANYVALVYTTQVDAVLQYPVAPGKTMNESLSWVNQLLCKVIGIHSLDTEFPTDVIAVPEPADGMCVCGVTCTGTEIQQVQVYQELV